MTIRKNLALGMFLALCFSICNSSAMAVEAKIYGDINYKTSYDENSSGKAYLKAENNGSKVGINATEDLGAGITGFATIEVGVDTDDSNNNPFDSRLAYVGINVGQAGSVSAGRQSSPFTDNISGHTNVFNVYGSGADQNLFARDSNTIAYSNTMGPLTFDGLVKIDGSTGKDGVDVSEYTGSMDYGIISASGGVSSDHVNNIDYYGAGVTVSATDNISVGYTYTFKDTTTDVSGNEIIGSLTLGETKLTGGYGKVESGSAFYTTGAQRNLTDSLLTYVEYQHEDKTGSSIDTDSYSAGLKFTF